jgi:hypothetical protein
VHGHTQFQTTQKYQHTLPDTDPKNLDAFSRVADRRIQVIPDPLCCQGRGPVAFEGAPALVAVKVVRPVGRSTLTAPARRCEGWLPGRVVVLTSRGWEYRRVCGSGKWLIRSVDVRG